MDSFESRRRQVGIIDLTVMTRLLSDIGLRLRNAFDPS